MLRNYFKIAYRNLTRHKFISAINLFGLTVGLSCCLLILAYIVNEMSYDRYNRNADDVYRVERTFNNPETGTLSLELGTVAPPVGPLLENDFKEIRKMTRVLPGGTIAVKYGDKIFNETNVYFTDENFTSVFDVDMVKGNPTKALAEPYSLMMTEEMARKYFGSDDPVNKIVRLDNQITCTITGIYKRLPANAHLHPDFMLSFSTLRDTAIYGEEQLRTNWGNNSFFTYLLLPKKYDAKKLEAQMPAFLDRHYPEQGKAFKPSQWTTLTLRKLTDIHLLSHKDLELEANGDIKRVYIFSAIALFVLLIACINYMNLSTARSVLRAKEIGVRKVVGARKSELIAQFLSESVLVSWLATLLAFGLTWLALPGLSRISGQQLDIGILLQWKILVPVLLMPFAVGLLSGLYPALFLSSFQPIRVLKGMLKVGGANVSFRKALVVAQFSISIILIVATIVVYKQLRYMQEKALGFDREQVVTLANNSGLDHSFVSFRTALLADPNIRSVGRSSRIPTGRLLDAQGSRVSRGDSLAPTQAEIKYVTADEGFISTYGVAMAAGRNFTAGIVDTSSFLINEAAVAALGIKSPADAIGQQFQYGNRKGTLAGVFKDFNFESLHQRILPIVLFESARTNGYGNISIKIAGKNVAAGLATIEKTWKAFLPEAPFTYAFMDDSYDRLYDAEQKQGIIFTIFACIAIFIACLGLFGLSAFTISQRVKEIGIRKVLGADVGTIVGLLSRDFLRLVVIAAIIAFPIAWYAMHQWLEDFAYRIGVPWWVFILAGILAAGVAFFTISFQAVRAATANPIKNLRTE